MNILRFDTYAEAMNALKVKIASLAPNLDKPKLIIVPEIYTFAAEREFYSLGRGSFDVRVCSFTKLYCDLLPENASMSRAEAIALIGKIAIDNSDKLRYYAGAFSRRGFAAKVYETVEKLSASDVAPQKLCSDNVQLDRKLADLRLIYSEYRRITGGKKADGNGRIEALTEWIKNNSTVIDGSEIYAVNFDVFTVRQRKLLAEMDKKADLLHVYAADKVDSCELGCRPTVYAASSKQNEYDKIADFILADVKGGMRFGDINVLGEDLDYYRLKRAFDARGIRFYFDRRKKLSDTEPCVFLKRTLACAENNGNSDNFISLAENRIAVPDKTERDRFIRYVKAYSAFFVSAKNSFDKKDDPDYAAAEKIRCRLVGFADIFSRKKICTAAEFSAAVCELLEICPAGLPDEKNGRYVKLLLQCADWLVGIFGGGEYGLGVLAEAFVSMTDGIGVPLIPNSTDTVFVGPLNSRRGFVCKKLYITGFNDGVLPARSEDTGLLSDSDVRLLEEGNVIVEPTAADMNDRLRDELMQLACSARGLVFSYVADGENKKSYLLRMFEKYSGIQESFELTPDSFYGTVENGSSDEIVAAFPSHASCLYTALVFGDNPCFEPLKLAVGDEISEIKKDLSLISPDVSEGGIIVRKCSASALKSYFDCPKMYFYGNALGIKKPKDGKIAATDIGTLLHEIIETFVRRGNFDSPELTGAQIAEDVLSRHKEYSLKSNERLKGYIKRDAVFLCSVTARQLTEGDFTCADVEISYGENFSGSGTDLEIGGVVMQGRIDRIDAYKDYARIIDYKSGKKVELSPKDVYYGGKLQLPIYAAVARKMGYKPAGMFYFPVNGGKDSGKLKGFFLDDPLIKQATGTAAVELFDFDINKKSSSSLVSSGDMDAVIDYSLAVAEKAILNMKEGYFAASPVTEGDLSVCKYCDFASVCKGARYERRKEKKTFSDLTEAVNNGSDQTTE